MSSSAVLSEVKDLQMVPVFSTAAKQNGLGFLPAEVHMIIAQQADGDTLRAIRLVSRQLCQDIDNVFADRFFSEVRCSLWLQPSMQRLDKITVVPLLAKHVKYLVFHRRYTGEKHSAVAAIRIQAVQELLKNCFKRLAEHGAAQKIRIEELGLGYAISVVSCALVESGHTIRRLMLFPEFREPSEPEAFAALLTHGFERVCSMAADLVELEISCPVRPATDGLEPYGRFQTFLLHATHLQSLTMRNMWYSAHKGAVTPSRLRILRLIFILTNPAALIGLLSTHKDSLKEVALIDVSLSSDSGSTAWSMILLQLGRTLQLTDFTAKRLERNGDSDSFDFGVKEEHQTDFQFSGSEEDVTKQIIELGTVGEEIKRINDYDDYDDEDEEYLWSEGSEEEEAEVE